MTPPIEISPPPFPIDALPEKTRQIVGEIQRQTQTSVSTIASAVLCAMATAAQFKIVIEHADQDRRLSWPSLFMVNIDDCGAAKSEVFRLAFEGLHRYQQYQSIRIKNKHVQIQNQLIYTQSKLADTKPDTPQYGAVAENIKTLKIDLDKLNRANDPSRWFIQSHAERLSLSSIATQSGWRAAIINPEADSALGVSSLKKLDNFSRGWDCQDKRVVTALEKLVMTSRDQVMDPGLYRHAPHISVCIAMRSVALHQYLTKNQSPAYVGSFIERCLFSWADDSSGSGRLIIPDSSPTALASFQKQTLMLANLDFQKTMCLEQGLGDIKKNLLDHYWNSVGPNKEFVGLPAYISYQYENTLRVAAVLELIEDGRNNNENLYIAPEILQSATTLIEWHIQTYLFIFFTGVQKQTLKDAIALRNKLQTIAKRMLQKGVDPQHGNQELAWSIGRNELYQQRPDRTVGTERFAQVLMLLIRQGLISEVMSTSTKKWLRVYTDPLCNLAQVSG